MGMGGTQYNFAKKINDDLLVEIFDFCRLDNISPNTYPQNWWYTLAHVCQKWRRVLFATPTRLGITLVCNSRTPVADLLAHSPPSLPLVIYWGNPGTFDTDKSVESAVLALGHRDRVRRATLRMDEDALRKAFALMGGPFPVLETLQVWCSSSSNVKIPAKFEAPNLRHLQLSDVNLLPRSLLNNNVASHIVSFTIGEISTKPEALIEYLAPMPHLRVLKIGVSFAIPSERTERKERELSRPSSSAETAPLALTDLEEFEYQGISDYLEAFAARISAPFLKKLSITISNEISDSASVAELEATTFKHLSRLISGAPSLAFQFCRVRFKDGISVVLDHEELWTGRGAFELRFNSRGYFFYAKIGLVAKICRVLAPMPSSVQSLLLEDAHRNEWHEQPEGAEWRALLRVFEEVKTLRVAGRFVDELDGALGPKEADDGGNMLLLPRLQEIVWHNSGRENKEGSFFAAFVQARQAAGAPVVRVVKGPQNRLTLV